MFALLPSFSFVVPAYNAAPYIERCVASLVDACAIGDQIIVVDDGSTDRTPIILQDMVRRHPELLQVLRQENSGQAIARYRGIAEARQPYVLFLDADDEIIPDTVASARQLLARTSVDILCCDFKYWNGAHLFKNSETLSHPVSQLLTDTEELLADSFKDAKFYLWSKIYKRDIVARLLGTLPRVRHFEDIIGIPMILKASSSFLYLPQPLVKYRQHGGSMTTSFHARQCHDLAASLQWLRPIVQEAGHARLSLEYNVFCVKVMYWVVDDWLRSPDRRRSPHRVLTTTVESCMTMPLPEVLRLMKNTRFRRLARRVGMYWAWPGFYLRLRRASLTFNRLFGRHA